MRNKIMNFIKNNFSYLCALALLVSMFTPIMSPAPVRAAGYDLLTPGSYVIVNGAVFESYTPKLASGTGVFEPFVRVQGKSPEKGYNTDGTTQWDTKTGKWTHAIRLGDIPLVWYNPPGPATPYYYRELQLDTNENVDIYLTLSRLEIWITKDPNITDYVLPDTGFASATRVWSLDEGENNWINLNYALNPGSGGRDNAVYFPENIFAGYSPDDYFVLFTEFGGDSGYPCDAGFEEWGVVKKYSICLEKLVNMQDADTPPGPSVPVGSTVQFNFVVTNHGTNALTNVVITDDVLGIIGTIPTLGPLESEALIAYATATAGQHTDIATVTTDQGISAQDPGNYFGLQ